MGRSPIIKIKWIERKKGFLIKYYMKISSMIRSENEGYYLIRELFRKTTIDIGEEVNEIYVYIRDEGMMKMSKKSGKFKERYRETILIAWRETAF